MRIELSWVAFCNHARIDLNSYAVPAVAGTDNDREPCAYPNDERGELRSKGPRGEAGGRRRKSASQGGNQERRHGASLKDLADLEATVAKMRELGVTEYGDIKLGPAKPEPAKEVTPEEYVRRAKREEERRRDVQFAASATRPFLPKKVQ